MNPRKTFAKWSSFSPIKSRLNSTWLALKTTIRRQRQCCRHFALFKNVFEKKSIEFLSGPPQNRLGMCVWEKNHCHDVQWMPDIFVGQVNAGYSHWIKKVRTFVTRISLKRILSRKLEYWHVKDNFRHVEENFCHVKLNFYTQRAFWHVKENFATWNWILTRNWELWHVREHFGT